MRRQGQGPKIGDGGSMTNVQSVEQPQPRSTNDSCLLQIRLPSGETIRNKFKSSDTIKQVYEFISSNTGESENFFTVIVPNPRVEYDHSKMHIALSETDLVPRGSLTVLKNISRGVINQSNIITQDVDIDNMSHEEMLDLETQIGNVKTEPIESIEIKINNLPTRICDNTSPTSGDTPKCLICQGEYELNEIIKTLPCSHEYHNICIDPWLRDHNFCPLCHEEVVQ